MTTPTPFDTLQQIAGGYGVARCLHVAAELGVADRIDDAPRAVADVASDVGAHAESLKRVLRLLGAHGIFEVRDDTVGHSAASRLLRTDHPQSMRSFVRMIGMPTNWSIYGALEHAVRSGRPAAEHVLQGSYWGHFESDPEDARVFNAAMEAKARGQVAAVVAVYDFGGAATIGDIGGGRGHLLRAVLDAAPGARGVLFDLPRVVNDLTALASDRLTLQPGDFFHDALPACELYMLMEVIHDWNDDDALRILQAVRRAAPPQARVLLLETMISDAPGPDWAKMLDIHMLALLGGLQRTRQEYAHLLEGAGFTLRRQIDTRAGISILEAVAA
ncbi:MAG TPA: methyltransferase [Gemmatimonadaceae bacterium]|nr:methyltransferase [Gemmatimonadaceae bacterium]